MVVTLITAIASGGFAIGMHMTGDQVQAEEIKNYIEQSLHKTDTTISLLEENLRRHTEDCHHTKKLLEKIAELTIQNDTRLNVLWEERQR